MVAMLFIVYNTFEFKVFVASIRVGPIVGLGSSIESLFIFFFVFVSCANHLIIIVFTGVQIPLALIRRGVNSKKILPT